MTIQFSLIDLYMTPKKKTETFEPNHYGVIRGKTPPGNIYEDTNWSRQEQNSRMRVSNGLCRRPFASFSTTF